MVTEAGYVALVLRNWVIPQGADTINSFRYGTRESAEDDIVYPELVTDGWSATAQLRKKVGGDVWITLSSADGSGSRIELTDEGYVHLILVHDDTEDEAWNVYGSGVYDLELLSPDDEKIRLAKGNLTVSHDVTRAS